MLSTGARASTPLKPQADGIRQKLSELGEDAAEVSLVAHAPAPMFPGEIYLNCEFNLPVCATCVSALWSKRMSQHRDRRGGGRSVLMLN